MREKYSILKEHEEKQRKQVLQTKVDLQEFKIKSQKFERILTEKLRDDLKEFAQEEREFSSNFESQSESQEEPPSSRRKEQNLRYQRLSVWDKLNMKRLTIEASRGGSPKNFMHPQNSFFDINRDYQRFLKERKSRQQSFARLEKELVRLTGSRSGR